MVSHMNVFRILADSTHALSKLVLIFSIHWNRSAEGVSLLFQSLYALVFLTRYQDLLWTPPSYDFYLFFMKIAYIASSFYTIFLMLKVYPRSHEMEWGWNLALYGAVFTVVSFLVALIARGTSGLSYGEVCWTFSILLESVCVLPQLAMLRQTTVPTVIDSGYIAMIGSYRFFYILNWIYRGVQGDHPDGVAIFFGVIQTILYGDFAWVYYTRQRVKLRGGVVVDGDDMRRSILVGKLLARGKRAEEDEAEDGVVNKWGRRDISVSADDEPVMPQKKRVTPGDRDRLGLLEEIDEDHDELDAIAGSSRASSSSAGTQPRGGPSYSAERAVPGESEANEWRK